MHQDTEVLGRIVLLDARSHKTYPKIAINLSKTLAPGRGRWTNERKLSVKSYPN
jgi:hypothetical protein